MPFFRLGFTNTSPVGDFAQEPGGSFCTLPKRSTISDGSAQHIGVTMYRCRHSKYLHVKLEVTRDVEVMSDNLVKYKASFVSYDKIEADLLTLTTSEAATIYVPL